MPRAPSNPNTQTLVIRGVAVDLVRRLWQLIQARDPKARGRRNARKRDQVVVDLIEEYVQEQEAQQWEEGDDVPDSDEYWLQTGAS